MRDYASAFERARDLGIGRTVHAGEGRPPQEIKDAIELLHAQRIGHGTTLLDDLTVLDIVLERDVTIEACPTSNLQTSAIPSAEAHPLPLWLKRGVKACICTDNTLFSDVNAPREHERASRIPEMTDELITLAISHAHAAVFKTRS
jgi:adenosine deaminase